MAKVIAVFDIGKTNKKIVLFDNNFNVVYQHEEKFPLVLDDDGFECDDIDLINAWITKSIAEDLFNEYGGKNEFCRKTASPSLGLLLNSGIQILWLQKEKPLVYKKVRSILHFPQYLSYALHGKICAEPTSIGCHTFMWDFYEKDFPKREREF